MSDVTRSGLQQPLFRKRSISREKKTYGNSLTRYPQITLDSTENYDLKQEQKNIEFEKKVRDHEITKLIMDKDYYMKNAIENTNKIKELKKSKLNDAIKENDELKNQMRQKRQREQDLEAIVKNQRDQIKELEKRQQVLQQIRDPNEQISIDMNHQAIEINQDLEDFQNMSSTVPIFKNNVSSNSHSANKSGITSKYLSNKKNQAQNSNLFSKPITNNLVYPHQSEAGIDLMNSEGLRSFETPREKFRKKKQLNQKNFDIPQTDENYNVIMKPQDKLKNVQRIKKENSPSRVYVPTVNLVNNPDTLADQEIENASREELLHALKLLKKQNQASERQHKNEIEALTLKCQRAEMDQTGNSQNSYQRDAKIRDLENKLKQKEKELEMVYMRVKNSSNETTPLSQFNSSKKPQNLETFQLNDNTASQIQQPRKSVNSTQIVNPLKSETNIKQETRSLLGSGMQHADEELLQSTTHGKLKKITVWSNQERIHGISFQYLKHDGTLLEPNINMFISKNLRADFMDFDIEDDNDYVEEIQGKYNIKGVKDLIITSPTGKIKHFKPIGSEKSREFVQSDLDEVFTVKYDYAEKPLKIVFPNVFQYDMKGSRLNDKHDQNFYYMESTRCVSLANPSLLYIAGIPAVKIPQQSDINDELLAKAPMTNHYYSDNADASRLKEIKDDGIYKINWTDAELIFFEKKVKLYKMTIYYDNEFIYGFQFQYLTSDGYQLILGKMHIGVTHLDKPTKELSFDQPDLILQKIFMYRSQDEIVQKLIILTSDRKRHEFGRPIPDKDSKEILLEIKQSSYLYGSFIIHPLSRSPRDFVLSNLRVGEIKSSH